MELIMLRRLTDRCGKCGEFSEPTLKGKSRCCDFEFMKHPKPLPPKLKRATRGHV